MKKVSLFAVLCLVMSFMGMSAERNYLHNTDKTVGQNFYQSGDLVQSLGLSAGSSLDVVREYPLSNGNTVTRYQQTYLGVPIWAEQVVVTTDRYENIVALHGHTVSGIDQEVSNTTPTIKSRSAMASMKALANGDVVKSNVVYRNERNQLVIYANGRSAKLAYAVSFFTDTNIGGTPSRPYYIVDAHNGEVLFQYDGLTTADGTGPGGNAKTGQYEYGTDFPALNVSESGSTCTMTNSNVKSVNLNHGTSGSTAYSYACYRNTFKEINGAYSPINDAHHFGGVIFDMFSDWYNTAPLTFQLTMRVHYSNSYENAFWDGSAMTFGDGQNTFYPLVSLDVSAHEVSHGFTEQNSALVYAGESGGMNEAFSDMSGEAAEFYNSGSNDWQVGAEIFKGSGALRYMNDPPLDGRSIGSALDYSSGMDVHYSSGVFNKAFYLLSSTSGWDTHKAFDVMVKANQLYWTSNATFVSGRDGCLSAAGDLGYSVADVQAAFDGVDVGQTPPPPTTTDMNNGDTLSSLSGSSGSWQYFKVTLAAGDSNLNVTMSGGTGDADLYSLFGSAPTSGSYDCRPYASGNSENCSYATTQAGDYYFGIQAYSAFTGVSLNVTWTDGGGPSNVDPNAAFSSSASGLTASFTDSSSDSDGSIASWSWSFGDGNSSSSQNPSNTYAADGTYTVSLTVTDNDGATDSASASVTVTGGGGGTWSTIDSNNFDSGWGIWNDGGADVRRSTNDSAFANSGTYCVRLRDNTGVTSSMSTDSMDLSGNSEARVSFSFYPSSMENAEDFLLEVNESGSWVTVGQWVNVVDFTNGTRENPSVTFAISGSSSTQMRIRCDASGNGDRIYIDDVVIEAK